MLPSIFKPGNLREVVIDGQRIGPSTEELKDLVPLTYIMNWFEPRIDKTGGIQDTVLIVESKTGSGKSTALPPEFFHRFFEKIRKNIAVTQPRVLTSVEIPSQQIPPFHTKEALRKAGHPNRTPLQLGVNLGYQNGVIAKKPVKGIVYMTIGVLYQQLCVMSDDEICQKYGLIVIDEAHERSIGLDMTLYMLKRFVRRVANKRERPFVVAMSATLDVKKFADYLLEGYEDRYKNIISVAGLSYPIQENWLPATTSNYITDAVRLAIQIHINHPEDHLKDANKAKEFLKASISAGTDTDPGASPTTLHPDGEKLLKFRDILIFTNGAGDIRKLKEKLEQAIRKSAYLREYPYVVIELTSDVVQSQSQDYRDLFADIEKLKVSVTDGKTPVKIRPACRRIIVATNVAETGVTIDTLKYVIETGFVKSKEYNPCWNIEMLVNRPVTESMYLQRRGRVGRKAPGNCYALYTAETRAKLQKMQYPDIQKDQIAGDLLNILIREHDKDNQLLNQPLYEALVSKVWEGDAIQGSPVDLMKLDLLDLPSTDGMHRAIATLYELGMINRNLHPTKLGVVASRFRFVGLQTIKMLLAGYAYGACMPDLITIAACIQSGMSNVFGKSDPYHPDFLTWLGEKSPKLAVHRAKMLMADESIQALVLIMKIEDLLVKNPEVEVEPLAEDEEPAEVGEYENKDNDKDNDEQTDDIKGGYEVFGGAESALKKFCDRYGLNLKSLIEVLDLRDQIIQMLAMIGLNPYQNSVTGFRFVMQDWTALTSWTKLIKQCIYEGFWQNLALRVGPGRYMTYENHLEISIDSLAELNALYIIPTGLMLKSGQSLYEPAVSGFTSVMDGFVSIDLNRAIPG